MFTNPWSCHLCDLFKTTTVIYGWCTRLSIEAGDAFGYVM